jgi:3,4-dehydroadipyl-CoA semialdehyde dehydrogenase
MIGAPFSLHCGSMAPLPNYVSGQWAASEGMGISLRDPVTDIELATVCSTSVDYRGALQYARCTGGPELRSLSYSARAQLLDRISQLLASRRDAYYAIALENSGSPQSDAAIDVDGAIFTLKYFARQGATLGKGHILQEGEIASLAKNDAYQSLHIGTPLKGVAS